MSTRLWWVRPEYFQAMVLANHYGLSDQQLDFFTSYDIKYRTSQSSEGDND
jgi:hypothetical protein